MNPLHWLARWTAPASPVPLGLLRIGLAGYALSWQLPAVQRNLLGLAERSPDLASPMLINRLAPVPFPPSTEAVWVLMGWLWLTALLTFLGIGTRLSLILFTLPFFWACGAATSMGAFDHGTLLPCQVLLILCLAPGCDALSWDRWRRWRRSRRQGTDEPLARALVGPHVSGWGTRLTLMLLVAVYVTAGLSKFRHGGGEAFLSGDTLMFYLVGQGDPQQVWLLADATPHAGEAWRDGIGLDVHAYMGHDHWLNRFLVEHPWMVAKLSWMTVIFEIGAFVALFHPRVRNVVMLSGALFHTMIGLMMGHPFHGYRMICLALVDWRLLARDLIAIANRVLPAGRSTDTTVVFYDGVCGLCEGTVAVLLPLDRRDRLRFAPLQSELGRRTLAEHGLPTDYTASILALRQGRLHGHSDAVIAIGRALGGAGHIVQPLRLLPRSWRDAAYRCVASNRYAWFGRRATCHLPTPEERRKFLSDPLTH